MSAPPYPQMMVTFSPAWWHAHYGLDFGEAVWTDPIARTERDRELRRLLWERFGEVGLGEENPEPKPNVEAYGHRFMAALWGCEVRYLADQAPAAVALPGAEERMRELRVPDLEASPVIQRALSEARLLEERYGRCDGWINAGGPLNNAVSVLGAAILSACLEEPELARRVNLQMAQAILGVFYRLSVPVNGLQPAVPWPGGGVGNCPVCMISPRTYAEAVLPADLWFREHFLDFGIHHCGVFTAYIEVYKALRPNGLDMGWGTDWRAVREAYPSLPLSLEIQDSAILGKTPAELDEMVAGMAEAAAPLELISRMWVAEAAPETPDETVRTLMTAGERLWGNDKR